MTRHTLGEMGDCWLINENGDIEFTDYPRMSTAHEELTNRYPEDREYEDQRNWEQGE